MATKPSNLIYGVDDNPPTFITFLLGLEHVAAFFIAIVFPVLIVKELGGNVDPRTTSGFISLSMIAGGVTTILQALKKGPVGSGYLCPSVCGPSYLSASMMAVRSGGLPLLFGMTACVGVVEVLFSRVMHKLRFLFPTEVVGVVVAMVGIVLVPLAVNNFLGLGGADTITQAEEIIVAIITFGVMIGLNVYSKGKLRLFCALIGMIAGYIASYIMGIIPSSDVARITEATFFALPHISNMSWKFDFNLLIPFVVAALCSTLKTIGDIATCQKINDADWKRLEMKSVSGGILADGFGGIIPGIIGGFGQSTSSTHVGMSVATGATSRRIAYAAGGILIALAFSPHLAGIFLIMPKPVIGAALIFAASFMVVAGLQIIMSRMLDARKIFVVGASIIIGLSADMIPGAYENVHSWIQPIFSSSLSLATVTVIVLNLILRIGIAKHATLELTVGEDLSNKIFTFMEKQGGAWGARKEVIYKAISAMNEFLESVTTLELTKEEIKMDVSFDEFNLDIDIHYDGTLMEFPPVRPMEADILKDEKAVVKLSGFLISKYVDRVKSNEKNGHCRVQFHLDH